MNILLCCPFDLDRPGGVTTVVGTLARRLRESGDHVVLLKPTHRFRATCTTVDGVRHYEVPMRGYVEAHAWRSVAAALAFLPLTCWRLARILKRERIDVVNAHYFSDALFHFVVLRMIVRFGLVVSVHGNDVNGHDGPRHRRLMERWAALIDRVVFCSDAFRLQTFPVDTAIYRKSQVILNGTSCAAAAGSPSGDRRHAIVSVAHLNEEKAPEILLRAFHRLAGEFPRLELDFVGDGPLRATLTALAQSLSISDRVHFHGRLAPDEAIAAMKASEVLCLPSRRESFGLVVIEAMATRTPVVASRVGGIPEVVRDGVDGLLVPPEQPEALAAALRTMLTDRDLRRRMVEAGARRVADRFTARRFIEQYRAAYASVCAVDAAAAPRQTWLVAETPPPHDGRGGNGVRPSTLVSPAGDFPAKTA